MVITCLNAFKIYCRCLNNLNSKRWNKIIYKFYYEYICFHFLEFYYIYYKYILFLPVFKMLFLFHFPLFLVIFFRFYFLLLTDFFL